MMSLRSAPWTSSITMYGTGRHGAVGIRLGVLAGVEDPHDRGVRHARGGLGLEAEPRAERVVVRELAIEDLDRDARARESGRSRGRRWPCRRVRWARRRDSAPKARAAQLSRSLPGWNRVSLAERDRDTPHGRLELGVGRRAGAVGRLDLRRSPRRDASGVALARSAARAGHRVRDDERLPGLSSARSVAAAVVRPEGRRRLAGLGNVPFVAVKLYALTEPVPTGRCSRPTRPASARRRRPCPPSSALRAPASRPGRRRRSA